MASNQHLSEKVNLKLDAETLEGLARLAARGDRTIAAEMRRALRAYLKTQAAAEEGSVA